MRYLSIVMPTLRSSGLFSAAVECERVSRAWHESSLVKVPVPGLQSRRRAKGQVRRREAGCLGPSGRNRRAMNKMELPQVMFAWVVNPYPCWRSWRMVAPT
jgi:hypothetical protein